MKSENVKQRYSNRTEKPQGMNERSEWLELFDSKYYKNNTK